jgi:hypothetical protein
MDLTLRRNFKQEVFLKSTLLSYIEPIELSIGNDSDWPNELNFLHENKNSFCNLIIECYKEKIEHFRFGTSTPTDNGVSTILAYLPNLKSFHGANWSRLGPKTIGQLIVSCPNLESLQIYGYYLEAKANHLLFASLPLFLKLSRLQFHSCHCYLEDLNFLLSNLPHLKYVHFPNVSNRTYKKRDTEIVSPVKSKTEVIQSWLEKTAQTNKSQIKEITNLSICSTTLKLLAENCTGLVTINSPASMGYSEKPGNGTDSLVKLLQNNPFLESVELGGSALFDNLSCLCKTINEHKVLKELHLTKLQYSSVDNVKKLVKEQNVKISGFSIPCKNNIGGGRKGCYPLSYWSIDDVEKKTDEYCLNCKIKRKHEVEQQTTLKNLPKKQIKN